MRTRAVVAWVAVLGSAPAQGGWTLRAPTSAPPPRGWHLLDYDVARGVTVLFGGFPSLGGTWEWNGSTWAQRTPAASPSPRCCGAHGYDLIRTRIVLFGGLAGSQDLDDTWEYDGTNWVQIVTPLRPSSRRLASMALDIVRGRMVLFGGGTGSSGALGDMWEWDGAVWTQLFPAHSPLPRWSFGMATDMARGAVLLHGGSDNLASQPVTFRDTWSWNGTDWSQIATAVAPPPVYSFGFAYSWARGTPVLFGGEPTLGETWLLAGNTWVRDPRPGSPSPRFGCPLAYDVSADRVVLFGGHGPLGDTWEYAMPTMATWLPFGAGCAGSTGVPVLRPVATARPVLGTIFPFELVSVPNSGLAAISIGFSATTWNGGALPASLASLGMPGCTLSADPQFVFVAPVVGGRATLNWWLPNVAAFAGAQFYNQGFVLDPGANALGAVVSNAGAGVVGTL